MALTHARRSTGFTMIEVIVTLVFVSVVGVALTASTHHAIRILQHSRSELNAARFLASQVERLRLISYDSLGDGTRTEGRGVARWVVVDSTAFRRVLLETRYGSPATGARVDSVTIYRIRP